MLWHPDPDNNGLHSDCTVLKKHDTRPLFYLRKIKCLYFYGNHAGFFLAKPTSKAGLWSINNCDLNQTVKRLDETLICIQTPRLSLWISDDQLDTLYVCVCVM